MYLFFICIQDAFDRKSIRITGKDREAGGKSMKRQSLLHTPDLYLLVPVILLVLFGAVMIGSANGWRFDQGAPSIDPLMIRQVVGLLLGTIVMVMIWYMPKEYFKLSAVPLYIFSLILLLIVLRFGEGTGDDDTVRRWLPLTATISIQPSEVAKVVMILAYAWYFDRFQKKLTHPLVILGAGVLLLIPLLLVFEEPDLSTSLVLCAVAFSCVFIAGVDRRIILLILAIVAVGAYVMFSDALSGSPELLNEYQAGRILAWLNPEEYSLTLAYQSIRSRMAIGSGGLIGKGLFNNAGLVPVATTDFIFGIIGEELGLVGCSFLVIWIFVISGRILYYTFQTEDIFKRVIFAGTGSMIAFQSLVHMGVNLAVLPNTGIPLPFVSYGLSSLTVNMAAIGLVLRLHAETDNLYSRRSQGEHWSYRSR